MGKTLVFLFVGILLFSCRKDKTAMPCSGVDLDNEKSVFVGKWRWYKTWVVQWFDVGPSITHNYTPQNQGFDYYFSVSIDGKYYGYRNDTLIHSFLLSNILQENFQDSQINFITSNINCSDSTVDMFVYNPINNTDSIRVREYPFHFNDQENHLYSTMNFFVKE